MRINLPVTDHEFRLEETDYLISRTDLAGRIVYANHAFVRASGYALEELLGAPHNLVRHPDMPPGAFADLWKTLKAGQTWLGVVKNRRRNGDFYWVLANASPIFRGHEVVGYSSVRTRPTQEQIDAAAWYYAQWSQGRQAGATVAQGRVVPVGWRRILRALVRSLAPRTALQRMLQACVLGIAAVGSAGWTLHAARMNPNWLAGLEPDWIAGLTISGVLALAGYAGMAFWRLRRSLQQSMQSAYQLAAGNLTSRLDFDDDDELGRLRFALEVTRCSMISVARDMGRTLGGTQKAGEVIGAGGYELLQRTQLHDVMLEQTEARIKALDGAVQDNAVHVETVGRRTSESRALAQQAGRTVTDVEETISGIAAESDRMAAIVGMIDGIAFQTNILALNAAVEAARAGESGRGFSIVAAEVRTLAQKSAHAAADIKTLIEHSVGRMDAGVQQVRQAQGMMQQVLESVARVDAAVASISDASTAQHAGISAVNTAMQEIEQGTQQNRELVGELRRASELLDQHIQRLSIAQAVFQTP
ncbi:methyl-accepting chemotaxis protein [Corticimicrobacter populi]|uniref:Chemotaxis protein n=1 Tax=Corticimicrobacter populi TaxID=2175229 RepID=A0A2V1K054_9BURK|nr:PAS domain-containing methyl-accepting chemotaxis protein [Corticimicrobacter populi]PWF21182.1 chemotaxis protein [Corticimicrobacter populi]